MSHNRALWIATAAVILILLGARPASFWEFDEPLFSQALHQYDPIAHYPPPPGYPVFIFVARLFRMAIPDDFTALVTLNVIASAIGFVLLALAFARLTDLRTGIAGALIFYLSPAMLVHSTLPVSEAGALALLAAALYFAPTSPELFAAFAALTVGWRPQFSIFVVPLLFATLFLKREAWARMLIVFTIVCLAWLVPLTIAVGGVDKLIQFETGQAKYLAAHDAAISRSSWSPAAMLVHFISHPWGPRVMALPVFVAAAMGAWRLRRTRAAMPLAIAGVVYIAIALMIMDPADGVRYAIPFLLVIAFAAGAGAMTFSRRYEPVIAFGVGSIVYVSSFIAHRASIPSPAVQAAAHVPPGAAVGYEMSLWPLATYLLRDHPLDRIDASFARPDASLYVLTNGVSDLPGTRTFAWENTDAYWNLTRNLYRVVSLSPIGPERRFKAIRGVHQLERASPTESWRWLDADAAIEMAPATGVELHLFLPRSFPYPENTVTVFADERIVGKAVLHRGKELRFVASFPGPATVLRLQSERSISPQRDPRRLAIALHDVVFHRPAAAAAKRRAA